MFSRQPGRILDGSTADVACDHYRLWRDDIRLARSLGLKAYRLSLAWPRILPNGTGTVNERGLAYYDAVIDELLAAGIEPWVTLFHWDYPYGLYCQGGWLNARSPEWFADYTRVVVDRLSDRVAHWITVNEPQCFIGLGLHTGEHAPGDRLGLAEVLRAAHHVLLGHGRAVQVIREHARRKPQIGWAHTGEIPVPATPAAADVEAAWESWLAVPAGHVWNHTWWNDPVFLGHYPEAGLRAYGKLVPRHSAEDLALIAQPVDFFGTNNYRSYAVRRGADGTVETVPPPLGAALSHLNWGVDPSLLYWAVTWPWRRYRCPVVVTENGFAGTDWVNLAGRVPDGARIDSTQRLLLGLARAIEEGVPVAGYFHWSLLDNFEWSQGYRARFGLVHVDYATQRRTPKDSFHWYRRVIESHGEALRPSAHDLNDQVANDSSAPRDQP